MRGQVNKSECVGGLSTGEKIFHFASENQVTFGPVQNTTPVWSADGKWIAYASVRNGHSNLYRKRSDGRVPNRSFGHSRRLVARRKALERIETRVMFSPVAVQDDGTLPQIAAIQDGRSIKCF